MQQLAMKRSAGALRLAAGARRSRVPLSVAAKAASSTIFQNSNGMHGPRTIPTEDVLRTWQEVEAVCFDVDCTVVKNDGLDLLADFMGKSDEVARLTEAAMDGEISLEGSLEERLKIINCRPSDIQAFLKAYPPDSRLVPGIESLIKALQARGISVYLISGGFRELMMPVAKRLGIPADRVFANRMQWQWDDETGLPTRLVGFDVDQPTARNRGKPEAIAKIREACPYSTVVMIGDGITDLEAVQETHGADLFIGYGGVIERPMVAAQADWFIYDYGVLERALKTYKVAVVGSGAWASTAVKMIAENCKEDITKSLQPTVTMWVRGQTEHEGANLVETINSTHTNPKYLPEVHLGDNVVAEPDLVEAVKDADLIVFCTPHQYMFNICKQLSGKIKKTALAISLTKGMRVRREGPQLISQMVKRYLGIECCVLMGANIAANVANNEMSEAVVGYSSPATGQLFARIFQRPYFHVNTLPDPAGAEMAGTLKNIVAIGTGIVDGLGLGPNTKAAVIRQGLDEMRRFAKGLYPSVRDETFVDCCGVGDLIATCYGGRNRMVAETWTKLQMSGQGKTFNQLEVEMLSGQKLQGVLTSNEVQEIVEARRWERDFPLFVTINRIITGRLSPDWILRYWEAATMPLPLPEATDSMEDEAAAEGVVQPSPKRRKSMEIVTPPNSPTTNADRSLAFASKTKSAQ